MTGPIESHPMALLEGVEPHNPCRQRGVRPHLYMNTDAAIFPEGPNALGQFRLKTRFLVL